MTSMFPVLPCIELVLLTGCAGKFQEGFQAGYAKGAVDAATRVRREFESKIASLQTQSVGASAFAQVASKTVVDTRH